MPRAVLFAVADGKVGRACNELGQLDLFLGQDDRAGGRNAWSRMAAIAFAVHGIYTGMEDVMRDIARDIDGHDPVGATSHQALLDQMKSAIEGRRPALLDHNLHRDLTELKAFRHLVRHHYGVDLIAEKVEAKRVLVTTALSAFHTALAKLEASLSAS